MTATQTAARQTGRDTRRACHPTDSPDRPVRTLRSSGSSALIEDPNDQGGPSHDRRNGAPDPELLAFAHWLADWWLRRGRDLTDPDRDA